MVNSCLLDCKFILYKFPYFQLEECRVELEEKLKLLTQSAKMIEQLKIQLTASESAKQKLTEERDNALRGTLRIIRLQDVITYS